MADLDPIVESEVDSFSLIFPLPYRVSIIVVLGVWAWGVNLHYLSAIRIDVPSLVRYPSRTSPAQIAHHYSTYRFATILSLPLLASLLLFWAVTRRTPTSVLSWEILPNLYLLYLIAAFIVPSPIARHGRSRFLSILRRISIGGIAEASEGKFGDILAADVLTSYAKVFGDLFVALCMMFNRRHSTARPDRSCGGAFFVPLLICVPSAIRLRQCLIEYWRVRKVVNAGGVTVQAQNLGWGGQHLANALKYATAFPVTVLSAMQHAEGGLGMSEVGLYNLWLLSVFANSLYSFYWDVTKDWDLTLLSLSASKRSPPFDPLTKLPEYPYGLRRHRYFVRPSIYYAVICIDLVLRCTWSLKLSPHLHHINEWEGGIFLLELLEVGRRWVWIFFRVETEWVRVRGKVGGGEVGGPGSGPGMDLLLGDYGKFDED